MIRNS